MSSNLSLSIGPSKTSNPPSQTPSPSQGPSISSFGADNHPQRRSGGSGSFGAGSASRALPASARNNQSQRAQHKAQRRPRLADEDAAAESAVMHSTRNRKGQTSITHLMSFALPPRPHNHQMLHNPRANRRNPTWGLGSGYHAVDKARYIHANYRFIVDPKGDYRAQAMDADVHLDWASVLQILASAQSQSANCPICLSIPVAPRMAKCGHIFCLPCLLRYMHSADDTNPVPEKKARWKKCPICWDSVYTFETRPVRWFVGQEREPPRDGTDVVLRLIARQPGSTLALPRDGAASLGRGEDIPWYFAAEAMDYARVMKGSQEYMMAQYDREVSELWEQEREDELMFGEETQWTKKAVAAILELKERSKALENPPNAPALPTERNSKSSSVRLHGQSADGSEYHQMQQPKDSQSIPSPDFSMAPGVDSLNDPAQAQTLCRSKEPSISPNDFLPRIECSEEQTCSALERQPPLGTGTLPLPYPRARSESVTQSLKTSPYFFYVSLLHFYLSPLDIRILKAAFGDFALFPSTILPRVERVSTGHIVDDELRRRAKYLAHLPRGCEIAFLECDWTDFVAAHVLKGFSAEIERRRKRNREKDALEEKERIRAEKEEDDKRWAAARRRRPAPPPESLLEAEFEPLPHQARGHIISSSPDHGFTSLSPVWTSTRPHAGSAFASLASPSTSPEAPRTVWGTAAVPPKSPVLAATSHHEASDDDGWLQNWESDLLGDDKLAAQLEASSIDRTICKAAATTSNRKKKKGKKIMLMTTNARRGA